jgi:hypothetical protein
MTNIPILTAIALAACGAVARLQTVAPAGQPAPSRQEPPPSAQAGAPAGDGLGDLGAMTFGCSRAGLNAAAREAARVPSQGTYQFSYFRIVSDSHHASYEVHFKSNYEGEPALKYCVSVYCQQGWDPKTTKTQVSSIGPARQGEKDGAHVTHCGIKPPAPPARRRAPK